MSPGAQVEFVTFSPNLAAANPLANYWIRQATIRMRRELCWRWRAGALPPAADALSESLDLTRHWREKRQFFESDTTAGYLTGLLTVAPPELDAPPPRGGFSWAARELQLDDLSCFVLALALAAGFDSAAGVVMAACTAEAPAHWPTLALVQKLWDEPERALALADPAHPLLASGLLQSQGGMHWAVDWHAPLLVPALVARQLLFPSPEAPRCLVPVERPTRALTGAARLLAHRLRQDEAHLRVVPVREQSGGDSLELAATISETAGQPLFELAPSWTASEPGGGLAAVAALCWLHGASLFLRAPAASHSGRDGLDHALAGIEALPVTVFVAQPDRSLFENLPRKVVMPSVESRPLTWSERVDAWREQLGPRASGLESAICENARRFRHGRAAIASAAEALRALNGTVTAADFTAACRAEVALDIGDLAQAVTPRFPDSELCLPPKQDEQFQEVLRAMRSLTEVHYQWGTARVWNEAGISVLFAGPPGTGKTMAAEVLAHRLGLPMYRIDLSQVVNKYIGETEKNLKRLFDAADASDCVLFFDEADALFGRRTETRDAHDRYANLEVSYLLDRMERFKGLAILATNRKKDLDEAFLRRLRYILDFPLPGPEERLKIWVQSVPEAVDRAALDFEFLARGFPLAGGHIRSIVFNACLQAAHRGAGPRLEMEDVMVAVKREYDKMQRPLTLEQFGPYAGLIERIDGEQRQDRY